MGFVSRDFVEEAAGDDVEDVQEVVGDVLPVPLVHVPFHAQAEVEDEFLRRGHHESRLRAALNSLGDRPVDAQVVRQLTATAVLTPFALGAHGFKEMRLRGDGGGLEGELLDDLFRHS